MRASHDAVKKSDLTVYRRKKVNNDSLIERTAASKKKKSILTVENNAVSKECYSMKNEINQMNQEKLYRGSHLSSTKI